MTERPRSAERVYVGSGRPDYRQPRFERRPELTPAEAARMQFFRDAFEVGRQSYEKERADGQRTQEHVATRAVDLFNHALEKPFDVVGRFQIMDAYARGKLGLDGKRVPLRVRGLRLFADAALGSAATAADMLDLRLANDRSGPWYKRIAAMRKPITYDRKNVTRTTTVVSELARSAMMKVRAGRTTEAGGGAMSEGKPSQLSGVYAAGLEYMLDEAVSWGADKTVQKLTRSRAGYASPLAHTIYNISRIIPVADAFINPVLIESAFRMSSNVPIYGAPVEWLYKKLNDELRQSTPASRFAQGLANSMIRGQVDYERALERHEERAQRQAEGEQRRGEAMERGKQLNDRLQALELQANIQSMNEAELAQAIVTGEIPDEMRRVVLEQIDARKAAKEQKEAAAASQATPDPSAAPAETQPGA